MKKIVTGVLVVLAALVVVVVSAYRREVVVPVESDLAKYPELSPFQVGRSGFRGIEFDVDTNEYSFAFPVSFANAESYFAQVDVTAKAAGWKLTDADPTERVYLREKEQAVGPLVVERVSLRYKDGEVTLLREDATATPTH